MAVREPYITLANKAAQHPKTVAMTDREHRVWINAMLYANTYLTDGVIPRQWFVMNAGEAWKTALEHMTELGVLSESPSGSLQVCNYLEYQRSRSQIEADISRKSAMGKASGEARRKKSTRTVRSTRGSTPVQPTVDTSHERSCSSTHKLQLVGATSPQNEPAVQPCVEPTVQRGVEPGVEPKVEQNTDLKISLSDDFVISERADAAPEASESQVRLVDPASKAPTPARGGVKKASSTPKGPNPYALVYEALSEAAALHELEYVSPRGKVAKLAGDIAKLEQGGKPFGIEGVVRLIHNAATYQRFRDAGMPLEFILGNPTQYLQPFGAPRKPSVPTLAPPNPARFLGMAQ